MIRSNTSMWTATPEPHCDCLYPQQKVAILREHPVEDCRFQICATSTSFIPHSFKSAAPLGLCPKIVAPEAKLRNKTEVLAEVVEELVRTKKAWEELSGRWVAQVSEVGRHVECGRAGVRV